MMALKNYLLIAMSMTLVAGQRPSFAGSRPIGYPEIVKTTTEGLGNRFGEDDTPTTTIRLPIEAKGDKDLVDRLSKLPIDQQPFWLVNWQALEEHRKNPQTFEQKPNVFIEPLPSNQRPSNQQQQSPTQPPSRSSNQQSDASLQTRFAESQPSQQPLSLDEIITASQQSSQKLSPQSLEYLKRYIQRLQELERQLEQRENKNISS